MNFKSRKFRIAVVVSGVVLAGILFLVSPFFHVQEIIIQGNNRITNSDIEQRLGVTRTDNILLLNTSAARRRIMSNLYIGDVSFRRDLPGRLYVTVFERRPSAYVAHMGNFLVLDDFGRVLEIRSNHQETLPLLEGLHFTSSRLGEVLDVSNAVDFDSVVLYTQLLVVHGLIHDITHINVSDPANIRILINYLEFHVGGPSDADEKVRAIVEVLNELPDAGRMRGFVDMRDTRAQFSLQLLQ